MTHLEKLRQRLPQGYGAALITSAQNRYYLLDLPSSAGTLLVLPQEVYLIIDSRYFEIAGKMVGDKAQVILQDKLPVQVNEILQKHGAKQLLLEQSLTLGEYQKWQKDLPDVAFSTKETLTKALTAARAQKDAGEIARIEEAQRITDAAFAHILTHIVPGRTEQELALEMDFFMRKQGAQGGAFPTILVSGENSSLPHGTPGERRLQKGDFITMDFGAKVKGYCTDMTRTVALGEASDEMRKVYEEVLKAHLAAMEAIQPGANCKAVDAVARDSIAAAGYGQYFGHGLGHSLGIDVHEWPRLAPTAAEEDTLLPGMLVTDEPGIYLPGRFGVRIEDTVLVTEEGHRSIAKSPKELLIL